MKDLNKIYCDILPLVYEYRKKVQLWIDDYSKAEVMEVDRNTSSYSHYNRTVYLGKNANKRSISHEYGHEMYYILRKREDNFCIETDEFDEFILEFITDNAEVSDLVALAQMLCEEYQAKPKDVIPMTDYLGIMFNKRLPGFYSHKDGYIEEQEADIAYNEAFANIVGAFGNNDYMAIAIVKDIAPELLKQVCNAIDRVLEICNPKEDMEAFVKSCFKAFKK